MSLSTTAVADIPTWRMVCRADDLVADSGVVVWHEGEQVALFYLPGQERELYAVGNRDPRSGANVIGRGLLGCVEGRLVVAAPLYKQHYCLASGMCLEEPGQCLRVWAIRLQGEQVQLAGV
jgi:nitrite reductase (NADH) small subunit